MSDFVYRDMWLHYRNNVGNPTDDVYVKVLTPDFKTIKAIKYNSATSDNKCFFNKGMTAWKIDSSDEMVIKHPMLFGNGAFVVADSLKDDNWEKINRKKNLFIVAPKMYVDQNLLAADHFSFLVNKIDPKMSLHFHRTSYIPGPDTNDGRTGRVYRVKNHLPEHFSFIGHNKIKAGDNYMEFLRNGELDRVLPAVYDIFTRHLNRVEERLPIKSDDLKGGGTKQQNKKLKKRTKKFNNIDVTDMFMRLPIGHVLVIGVKTTDSSYDVSVVFNDQLNHDKNRMDFAYVLKMTNDEMMDDEFLEMKIAQCMIGKSWNDFVV